MINIPIFSFIPLQKELVWGGRKLESILDKSLPTDGPYGESWELVDLSDNQSVVDGGPFTGQSLDALLKTDKASVLGNAPLLDGRFPLLAKFIDAQQTLSVQVHPDETACARIGGGARPKTEAWYIIDREPGAKIYAGLKDGVSRSDLKAAIEAGTVEDLLYVIHVDPGDFVYLPAGTIHAIGAGILLAEIQQSSNTTYRVFDWNRMGLDGKPRPLHIEQALEATDYTVVGPPKAPSPRSGLPGVRSPFFEMALVTLAPHETIEIEGEGPLILMGVGGPGHATIRSHSATSTIHNGVTRFIPAAIASRVSIDAQEHTRILSTRIPS